MDITKPYFLIMPALISLFSCHFFFYELSFFVVINSPLILVLFAVVSSILMFSVGVDRLPENSVSVALINSTNKFNRVFWIIIGASFASSTLLVLYFSNKFGFYSIFVNASLLQTNAISNSLGNFLYLNVFVFPVLFILTLYKSKLYFVLLFFSLFFLYFAGIKSYMFQSFALLGLILLSGRKVGSLSFYSFLLLSALFLYFFIYDVLIDLASENAGHSFDRFLSYFSGSWATYSFYLKDGLETPYPGLTIFYPIYKLASMGQITLDEYYRFYEINGFQLNVVPLFQLAYLEGGFWLQLFMVFVLSFAYVFLRLLCFQYKRNVFFRVCLYFFCSTFIISSLFANVFQDLPVYISIFILIFAGFISQVRLKKRLR